MRELTDIEMKMVAGGINLPDWREPSIDTMNGMSQLSSSSNEGFNGGGSGGNGNGGSGNGGSNSDEHSNRVQEAIEEAKEMCGNGEVESVEVTTTYPSISIVSGSYDGGGASTSITCK